MCVNFPSIDDNAPLCPKRCLFEYISRPEKLRNSTKLFVSLIKPHGHVSTDTLARWVKQVFHLAGIDTSIFKAHSTRGAATSALFFKGAPIKHILSLANWSNERTFRRFYLRPTNQVDLEVGKMVLDV